MAEKMPDFPGGMEALMTYINKTIKYPEKAMKENISGRVIVQFIVRKAWNSYQSSRSERS